MLNSRVCCTGLLIENDSLLLLRYADPDVGDIWQYPGGGLEPGETISKGVRREMREETGFIVRVDRLGYILQLFTEDAHGLILYFMVTRTGGELGVDAEHEPTRTEMKFVHRDEVLDARILNPDLWERLWDDYDSGETDAIYPGARAPGQTIRRLLPPACVGRAQAVTGNGSDSRLHPRARTTVAGST